MPSPLDDILIIDLSTSVSGPFTGGMLSEFGARVIKVEAPDMTDAARYTGTSRNGVSAMYASINRGKESVVLDLKSQDGKDALWTLLQDADVLLQNFRPGALDKLGFDWPTVHERCPKLIYASISGFGETGPMANTRVYDPIIQAASGIADSQVNPVSQGPMLYQGILCDKITSVYMSQAILGALFARERGMSEGQKISLSMLDASVYFHWCDGMYNYTFLEDEGTKKAPDFSKFYRLTRIGEDYLTMPMMSDAELKAGLTALSLEYLLEDERFKTVVERQKNSKDLGKLYRARIEEMGFKETLKRFQEFDVPSSEVIARSDLADNPQIKANGTVVKVDHPVAGPMHAAAPPAKLSGTPLRLREPAPAKGENLEAIALEFGFKPYKKAS